MIQVKELSYTYPGSDHPVLKNISFDIQQGEIFGLIGPDGAGKSTIMKILTTYLRQNEGDVKVNGFDTLLNPMEVKRSVGYLPEHNPLYLELFVKEYLNFHANIHKVSKNRMNGLIILIYALKNPGTWVINMT